MAVIDSSSTLRCSFVRTSRHGNQVLPVSTRHSTKQLSNFATLPATRGFVGKKGQLVSQDRIIRSTLDRIVIGKMLQHATPERCARAGGLTAKCSTSPARLLGHGGVPSPGDEAATMVCGSYICLLYAYDESQFSRCLPPTGHKRPVSRFSSRTPRWPLDRQTRG